MPSIEENKQIWETNYDWSRGGDEWSGCWGSPRAQWVGCLLPRIFPFLGGRIVEIEFQDTDDGPNFSRPTANRLSGLI